MSPYLLLLARRERGAPCRLRLRSCLAAGVAFDLDTIDVHEDANKPNTRGSAHESGVAWDATGAPRSCHIQYRCKYVTRDNYAILICDTYRGW